jgi:transcriptional regulator with PAS, ATPase and Fis domain
LRVLQDKTYEPLGGTEIMKTNARIIAATNHDLAVMVETEQFRHDLYYRIRVIEIKLPPLRERMEDVVLLVQHFINRLVNLQGKIVKAVSPEVLRILKSYDYPGNVRELENIVEHGYVLCDGPLIDVEHLPEWLEEKSPEEAVPETLAECERRVILTALENNDWNRRAAARALGIHKSTLFRKINRLDIHLPRAGRRSSPHSGDSH